MVKLLVKESEVLAVLTEEQCRIIENGLTDAVEPRKVAAYLCLHMGLTLSEVAALRLRDLDLAAGTLCLTGDGEPRTLPMPPRVRRFVLENLPIYSSRGCFVMSGDTEPPPPHLMQNVLNLINKKHTVAETLSAMDLRNAFIRRCIQSGMDLYSLCRYIGVRQPNAVIKRFGEYFTPCFDALYRLPQSPGDVPALKRGMNLLILGAGSQGPVEREIAEAIGVFTDIAFLDDDETNPLAIGPLSDYERLRELFPAAIPSFGNSALRREYYDKLTAAGYAVPRLIHPSASISGNNVRLGQGVVVEAKVIIGNDVTVGDNVILSAGCVLDRECRIGSDCHVGCACTVMRGSTVPDGERISAGTVFDNHNTR